MKKQILGMITIVLFVGLTTVALAQSSAPSDDGTRPEPGMTYGQSEGQRQDQGQGNYGPGMMGGQGQGSYGSGWMGGYGAGWMGGGYGGIWATIPLVILGAGLVAWIVKRKGQVNKM